MAKNFVRIDGWPVAPAVAKAYLSLKADHDANCPCGVPMRINSGYRTKTEQTEIFTARYIRDGYSPYGDYRNFDGSTWGRVDPGGPVASPDVGSNHTRGYALDLDITNGGVCQQWMLQNAPGHGFNWIEGEQIDEWWHWNWLIGVRPDVSSPDPWEGGGAPDPVYPTDEGIPLAQLASITNSGKAAVAVAPTKGKKMDLFLLLTEPAEGGLRRWLVDVRAETKHELSSEKFNMYKNAGMPALPGTQPYTYGDEFRTI